MKKTTILILCFLALISSLAHAQSPKDVTDEYVKNPSVFNMVEWSLSCTGFINKNYASTIDAFEVWNGTSPELGANFTLSQQIDGLRNGKYRLDAQMASMNYGGGDQTIVPCLFANDSSCSVNGTSSYNVAGLKSAFDNEECTHSVECIVENETLTIGFKGEDMAGGCNWNACGHFKLFYYGMVSVTVGQEGYITFFDDVSHTIAEGAEVFAVVSDAPSGKSSLNDLKLKSLGNFIPANTGVVIKAKQGKYELTSSSETSSTTSILEGCLSSEAIPGDGRVYYTLCVDNGTPVFKKFIGSSLKANKAYLCIHASSNEDMGKQNVDNEWF